jgi:CHAT domain-containing protein/tetratricopeptide (TPR) repeat protein
MLALHEIGAILRRFDTALLRALAGVSECEIAAFLAGEHLELVAGATGHYRLRPAVREAILADLRASRPDDEVELHRRAFDQFLARLHAAPPGGRSLADEDDCLYHLDMLFILVGAQLDWRQITDRAAAVRAIGLAQPRHYQRLTLYEGYAAIRIQEYGRGETLLAALLAEPPLDEDVAVKALKGLADAAVYRADHERARDLYARLLIAAEASGDRTYQGLALLNLGLVHHELGDHALALDYCERSLPLFTATADERREAHALYHSALYSLNLGRWEEARDYSAAAERRFERLGMEGSLGYIALFRGMASHYFGELTASEAAYRRALALAGAQDGQTLLAMDARLYLGLLYQSQGRYAEAADEYEQALELASRLDQRHRACMIRYRLGQLNRLRGRPDDAFAAFQAAIEGVEALRRAAASDEIKIGLLGTVQQIYEAMVLLCLELERPAAAFHYTERARQQAFLDALARTSGDLSSAFAQPIATLAEVQASLPEGALLLAYFTIGVLPHGEHLLNSLPAANTALRAHLVHPPQTLIFAIDRARLTLVNAPLDPNAIRPPAGARIPGRHLLNGRLPEYLHTRLIGPVAELLAGRSILYLMPHGPLHHIPFGALRAPDGEFLLRHDGPTLAQVPSATVLLRSTSRPADSPVAPLPLFALGYNDPAGERPLRFAEAEARHVADLLGGTARIGTAATREQLLTAPAAGILHVAGHARFDPADPLGSGLDLADGPISARDLVDRLRLSGGLAVLSTCTSGTSRVVAGDELLGIQRALLIAGARAVICTRWEASDIVALLVMDHFYRAVRADVPPAVALRDAQIAVRAMTSAELAALSARWQDESAQLAEVAADLAALVGQAPDARPFADPIHWATFMLVGRA